MLKEVYYFLRYGPKVLKRKNELGLAEFMKTIAKELDAEGFAELRSDLVGDLEGDILEIGTGTGATFPYYGANERVTAIEPNDELRPSAEEAAKVEKAEIKVLPGSGEELPFEDGSYDCVCASLVLCSVDSQAKTLAEFKRVLKPGGRVRLMEHVISDRWFAALLMNMLNPVWL